MFKLQATNIIVLTNCLMFSPSFGKSKIVQTIYNNIAILQNFEFNNRYFSLHNNKVFHTLSELKHFLENFTTFSKPILHKKIHISNIENDSKIVNKFYIFWPKKNTNINSPLKLMEPKSQSTFFFLCWCPFHCFYSPLFSTLLLC